MINWKDFKIWYHHNLKLEIDDDDIIKILKIVLWFIGYIKHSLQRTKELCKFSLRYLHASQNSNYEMWKIYKKAQHMIGIRIIWSTLILEAESIFFTWNRCNLIFV